MTTRLETQQGAVKDLGSAYTLVGVAVPTGHDYNMHLNVCNILPAGVVKLRAFIVDASWTTALPTSANHKVAAIAFDMPITNTEQITGIVMTAGQQLVVWSDTTNGLDIIASGVDVTL